MHRASNGQHHSLRQYPGAAFMRSTLAWEIAAAIALLAGLLLVNRPESFLLFHSFAEIFTVVIAISVALVSFNARGYLDNDYLLFLGIAQSFVAVIDVLHLLGYKGMHVFASGGPNLSTQLWIAGRYLESASLVVAVVFVTRRVPLGVVVPAYAGVTALAIAAIFTGVFPACYVEVLTPFKVASEFVIALLFGASVWLLMHRRGALARTSFNLIVASIVVRIAAEFCFAIYGNVFDALAFAGHYLRIISFYLLYKAVFETGIVRPYATVVRDLRQSETDLRRSLQELEAFSYSVSHDLRSPVAAISGFAQLLEMHDAGTLTDDGRQYVGQIRTSARRMSELIDDLLSFSSATRSDLDLQPVDVTRLARDVAGQLLRSGSERRVDLQIEDGMVGRGDGALLRVVLENLVGNALKFTSKNERARIEIRKSESDAAGVFMVRDDGAGFDMKRADGYLFRPFHRLHTSAEFDGTGIGLATVARIIERHGGRVWAESEVGRGTTVYFALPD